MSKRKLFLKLLCTTVVAGACLVPTNTTAMQPLSNWHFGPVETGILLACATPIFAPFAAGFGLAANGFVQACTSAHPAITVVGGLATATLATEWLTHNWQRVSTRVHKALGYASRVAGTGLIAYGAQQALCSASKAARIGGGVGVGFAALGILMNTIFLKWQSPDPSLLVCADSFQTPVETWTRKTY